MANPNIANVSTINGNANGLALTASLQAIVTNASGTNKIYKVHSLIVSNTNSSVLGIVNSDITLNGTPFTLAKSIYIPARTTIVLVSKEAPVYLIENSKIELSQDTGGNLEAICSWDEIS